MKPQSLTITSVTAGYIPGMPIINDISATTDPGEIVCIIGPNGAGKSTLLKAVAGLLPLEDGDIHLGDKSISGIRTDKLALSGIAYVPQLNNIFRTMSVEQNLLLSAKRYRGNRRQRLDDMLTLFPILAQKRLSKAGSLSGGQRQFLAMAMALIARPSLLLLDEPSAGLSPQAVKEVFQMLREISTQGVGILMVEQNVKAALQMANRAYVLADGRKQHEGDARTMLHDPVLGEIYLGIRRENTHAAKSV